MVMPKRSRLKRKGSKVRMTRMQVINKYKNILDSTALDFDDIKADLNNDLKKTGLAYMDKQDIVEDIYDYWLKKRG